MADLGPENLEELTTWARGQGHSGGDMAQRPEDVWLIQKMWWSVAWECLSLGWNKERGGWEGLGELDSNR